MSLVQVNKSNNINNTDSVFFNSKAITFSLDDKNETESNLILIYLYVLPKFQTHGIKVGMTKCKMGETFWQAIKSRINNQVKELALTDTQYNLYGLEREVIYWGVCLDTNKESFKDYKVHDEILKRCSGLVEKEQEWFQNVPIDELVQVFNNCRNISNNDIFEPRKEQSDCIKALSEYFKDNMNTDKRFLLNCKMRFGKCFTAYKYCEDNKIDKILILTFIPSVEDSWEDDLLHIKKHYQYLTDKNLKKADFDFNEIKEPFVVFLSLQNYLGKDRNTKETKDKVQRLENVNWDIVILDEYHFGAWNDKTQGTMENLEDLDKEYQRELKKIDDVVKKFKIHSKQTICLSGTPFKAIANGEFTKDNTFTYSYFDEQRNKYPNSDKGDMETVNPKYEQFPDMRIFGYNMSKLFAGMTSSIFSGPKLYGKNYFSLNSFFETRKDKNLNEENTFIYEDEIKNWLEIIKGRSTYGSNFPYSNLDMLNNNKHTLWLLPRVTSVHAMAKLLREDEYFKKYEIIDLSAPGVGAGKDAFEFLNKGITAANNTNKLGSIALTVNKLTIGVTVKEWFSVFVLKDLASPEQYFQSIFRIQTPYKEDGKILKRYGNVYDFNIDRAAALLLKYAEQSEDYNVTKLDVANLIVKYLPIFVNGDMEQPISADVFYELAQFGDTSGIPLSKKIVDTSKTTRMLDEEVLAEMLNDNEVSDVLKRVFAHAKFGKTKTQTMLSKPEVDGFETKTAKLGRDKGYELGIENYEKYVDFDDLSIQKLFENDINSYINKFCPNDLEEEKKIWWINGFNKGYEGGVNAPVKKLYSGNDNGVAFVEKVKEEFGKNIVWTNETKNKIRNFINIYLNNIDNIPVEYRSALYKKWYTDSFIKAVKKELTPKIAYSEGRSAEDADNIIKHILSRLFEFLYISVYRETTFKEIFNNADPDIFLEAVGITKKDFEVLNKYRIFQEKVLNNYIHEFFVNESLGTKLNLEVEEVKKKYRNSFDWFGYGVKNEVEYKTSVKKINEMVEENNNSPINIAEESIIINNNSDDDDILNKIKLLLKNNPEGLKASKIASLTRMSKKEINKIMYSNKDKFKLDFFFNRKNK